MPVIVAPCKEKSPITATYGTQEWLDQLGVVLTIDKECLKNYKNAVEKHNGTSN